MLNHLKTKLAAEWHKLVTGTEKDTDNVLDWFNTEIKEILMTLFQEVEALQATVAAIPAPVDATAAIAAAVAPVEAKIDALAALVGTPSTPNP